MLGTRELQRGNAAAATGYLTAALKYGSYDSSIERQTRLWLGDAYYSQGKYKQARSSIKRFLQLHPVRTQTARSHSIIWHTRVLPNMTTPKPARCLKP